MDQVTLSSLISDAYFNEVLIGAIIIIFLFVGILIASLKDTDDDDDGGC